MKIAHISDLHLNTFFKNSSLREINILLKYIFKQKFDHLVITGDLTDNAAPGDFEILRKIFIKYKLLNHDRLSLVIGNHDIFGGIQTPEDILSFPDKCLNINYDLRVSEFCDYFSEAFDNCAYLNKNNFPYVKELDDIIIGGVNSIAKYSKIRNPFASNGEVSINEFNSLSAILKNINSPGKIKILLIHHYFNKIIDKKNSRANSLWHNIEKQTMKLRKKRRLFTLFKQNNIDLVLHGHLHESREYYRKGIRFLNAGGSIKSKNKDELQVNFLIVDKSEIWTEIHKIKSSGTGLVIHSGYKKKDEETDKIPGLFEDDFSSNVY